MSEPIRWAGVRSVRGVVRVPGDKSIAHRALMFAALADGRSRVRGLPPGGDVRSTRGALEALGVAIEGADDVSVAGRGWPGLARDPAVPVELDCGNSGTTSRLLLGLLAGTRGQFRLLGDASLSRRPMGRVLRPLRAMGAEIAGGDTLPLTVHGRELAAARLETEVASAQVKSALILAALQAAGESRVDEPRPSRDHTERLLAAMGASLRRDGERGCVVQGGRPRLAPLDLEVPGDPSSAAFFVALACLRGGSELSVERVGLNPRRTGFYRLLRAMGADLGWEVEVNVPEPVGTLVARGGALSGIRVGGEDVVDAIDEIPLLAVVAAAAEGETEIRGAGELRVKESDRIAATARLLREFGADCDELPDGLLIRGGRTLRGAAVDAGGDHRIAMAATVAASIAAGESAIGGHEWAAISYPGFFDELRRLTA
ncbi:MAG: 3-phosphoshikimate 1-carboxyvinyltransferase [Acidobacteria bacterium]|nr:3-phosphoshikimate 1-carboxyvinyltransferase [Acidobacteriota bacterium]